MLTCSSLSRLPSNNSTHRQAWSVLLAGIGAALLLCHATPAQAQSITIANHEPVTNAVGVDVSAPITVNFDAAVQASTVTTLTFTVRSSFRGLYTDTATVNGNTATLDPSRDFFAGEQVQVVGTAAISSTGGGPLTPSQWGFTAGPMTNRCVAGFVDSGAADDALTGVMRSSVAWGDYDNDSDLDILLTGWDASFNPVAKVYRNDNGSFVDSGAADDALTGVGHSSVAWGDYDNDGDLDILLTGEGGGFDPAAKIYRNDNGSFVDSGTADNALTAVGNSSVAWGDYDNDGDQDILLTGNDAGGDRVAKVFRNDNGNFVESGAADDALTGVVESSVAWGDYDNDGDLDILLTGEDEVANRVAKVYRNDNGSFTDSGTDDDALIGVNVSSVAWGDYDNDGDLDILLTGYASGSIRVAKVYRNNYGSFVDSGTADDVLTGVGGSSVAWGDYDNDGDLDVLLTGEDANNNPMAKVYRNDNGSFADSGTVDDTLTRVWFSSVAWGDYDNDGDLDILLTGWDASSGRVAKVYRNEDCADVGIVKTATPSLALPGAAITYTLSFSNAGPNIAFNVSVTDSVPSGLTIAGVSSSGVSITQTSGSPNFAWAVGNLAAGAGGVITLAGTVDDPLSIAGFTIVNTAAITADNDITPTNNVAFSVTNLKMATQSSVQSSRNPAPYGETVTITASVAISGVSASGAVPSPTGQVRFRDESGELATVNLAGGLAAFSRATWAMGTHTVTAEYLGDMNFIGSTSPPIYQRILSRLAARNDAAGTLQGEAVQIDPLANDLDPAGGGLVVAAVEQPASGSVAIDSGGKTVTYTPDPAFSGVVTFTYTARDSNGAVDDAVVAVVISAKSETGDAPQIGVVNNAAGSTHDFDSGSFQVQVQMPAGSHAGVMGEKDIFYLSYTEVVTPTGDVTQPPGSFTWAGMVFHLSAFVNGTDLGHYEFPSPVTLVITYDPALLGDLSEQFLAPYTWNGTAWVNDGISGTQVDTVAHRVTTQISHLSEFALFSQPPLDATSYLYLPAVATVSSLVTTQEMPGDATAEPAAAPAEEVSDGTAEPDVSAPADVPAVEPTPFVTDGESLLHLHLPLVTK